ncbi:hypothetical protein F444_23062 [Phytophthora nicotianae P1976]|uniref:Uncharacterized protein n=1 Tax=Phytophthora nicotianae P1976 TaxID=1317066 RepID=A0A080YVZ4_PHYNI|nr:hypothetical protein F444_23062 [Phytophthora nicotianae P1976]
MPVVSQVSSDNSGPLPCLSRCRSMSEPHHGQLKSARFIWSGFNTTFEDKELQRRTRDKIEQMMEQATAESADTNSLIAMKVLRYRKLSVHTATRCV